MTVNHWVPGSSPGRGANFKASDDCPGLFCITRTLARDAVPGYSARSASRSRAEARSAAQSSPGRGAKSKPQTIVWGFFVSTGLSPGTLSQVIRLAHPYGAAPKRVLLRSRVQVAEPNQSLRRLSGAFLYHPDSRQGRCPRLFGSLSFTEPRRSAFCCAVESRSRSQLRSLRRLSGAFWYPRDSPRDAVPGYSLRSPYRAALKRVLLGGHIRRGVDLKASGDFALRGQ